MEQISGGWQCVLEVHVVVVRLQGFGGSEGSATACPRAQVDSDLLAVGVTCQVEGVWVAFPFQVGLDGGGGVEAREVAAGGVIAPPDWAGLRPNDRRERSELPVLQLARR